MSKIPVWAWYAILGLVIIGLLAAGSWYLEAATELLPTGKDS